MGIGQSDVKKSVGLAQAAVGVALMAWKRPETLRPSNVAAVVTAPGRAAVGWAQETLIPPGPQLPLEDARALVLRWQAIKAQSMGARPAHLLWNHGRYEWTDLAQHDLVCIEEETGAWAAASVT